MKPQENFRDRIATVDASGKRKWVYARKPKGKYYTARTIVSLFFFALFLTLPFVKLNGRPLFMFNIPQAKFIIFGKVFWPQDFVVFGVAMVTGILFIVLFTAAFGRLFCGWVCPQTNFMEMLFRKIEYVIEGDASEQQRRNKGPWNAEKIRVKTTKHVVFFLIAFVIANYFLAYIIGVDALFAIIREPVSQHVGGFLSLVVFSSVFYAVYAFFREQACTVVCPYGRLQSVLLDRNSVIVAYDYKRGEPRGKAKPDVTVGDCVDCYQCVRVCPTGIDIRNGTQMECVGCTACIDACDAIMIGMNRPTGLVRYASESGIAEGKKLSYTGRMKFYTLVLFILAGLLTTLLVTRHNVDGTIVRAPGLLFQEVGTDSLSNLYSFKYRNKTLDDIPLELKLEGMNGQVKLVTSNTIVAKKEDIGSASFFIVLPRSAINSRKTPLKVGLYQGNQKIAVVKTNFMGPFNKF
ncbi:MAG TPA: cytochrome c oxidase accessory protein CcoG [Flavihumibacter sp.]|nr:cytochrome c oxidase accessory protein CcoG [Bacteroidota bacterium]HPZ87975.1 cytochrome c oxidase accessory protein CcoG [Flavihumibacter sp.]HQD09509.1 cytochrome c oxidase accessory protein CcoG [Flavihumibacter sp.]